MKLRSNFDVSISELRNNSEKPAENAVGYSSTLKGLCTLGTSEELSYFLHHLKPFYDNKGEVQHSYNLNIFREGIDASWEHPENINGCSYTLQTRSGQVSSVLFERLVAYFLLNGFQNSEVNGIKINVRKTFVKFGIWLKTIPNLVKGCKVNEELQMAFGLDYPLNFVFKEHKAMIDQLSNVSISNK